MLSMVVKAVHGVHVLCNVAAGCIKYTYVGACNAEPLG